MLCYPARVPGLLDPLWVDTPGAVAEVAAACRAAGGFALDTEADSLHSYFHKLCLLQVSAGDRTWLVDPLALPAEALSPLWDVLSDPGLPVLMHGADYDLRVLDRDHGARLGGLRDTQVMAQLLGDRRFGLAALLEQELGVTLDKSQQRADWSQRPLPPALLRYAAADTGHLERLAGRLRDRLEALGRWGWALEDSARLEAVRHTPQVQDPYAFVKVDGARGLEGEARDRLYTLHRWREEEAQRLDVPPFKVLGARSMLALALAPPDDSADLARVEGLGPRFARRWGREVLRALRAPLAAPPRQARTPRPRPDPVIEARVQRLLAVRDREAARLALDPGVVCPRALVHAVATEGVADARGGLIGWRRELLAVPFSEALEGPG
jgi:ribonuclease D